MKRAACLLVILVGCSSDDSAGGGGANPPTLWLAMNAGQTGMRLVGEEPHPY